MIFTRENWTPGHREKIARAAGADLHLIEADINAGEAFIYRVDHEDSGPDSWAVLRTEDDANRLVVVCYEGREVGEFARRVVEKSRILGLSEVLFFTRHEGLPRLIKDQRPELVEKIYRVMV